MEVNNFLFQISEVRLLDGEQPVKYSSEVMVYTDKYEIV